MRWRSPTYAWTFFSNLAKESRIAIGLNAPGKWWESTESIFVILTSSEVAKAYAITYLLIPLRILKQSRRIPACVVWRCYFFGYPKKLAPPFRTTIPSEILLVGSLRNVFNGGIHQLMFRYKKIFLYAKRMCGKNLCKDLTSSLFFSFF